MELIYFFKKTKTKKTTKQNKKQNKTKQKQKQKPLSHLIGISGIYFNFTV